jgi:glycosyltransferase involved in cell wall biosynthesis
MATKQLMNVMQLISSLEVGGSEKLLVDFLAACRDDDQVNFTVVIMNQAVNPVMRERLDRLGLNVYYLNRVESHKSPKYLLELLKIIYRHKIEVVHAHNFGSKLWAVLCKICKPTLRLVFTVHDTMTMPKLNARQIWLHRHVIDCNIAISKKVASLCENRGVVNCSQIYNGIPLAQFLNPQKPSLQARLACESFSQKPMHIIHVGRMDYSVKGQDILIKALRRCKDVGLNVRCSLMGGVYAYNEKAFSELKAMVVTLDLAQEVQFLVNRTDVPQVMADGDLFVLPSRFEGLGLVVLEAMAAGLPVISSNTDGPKELVDEGLNGLLFDVDNVEHLFEKIRFAYENPEQMDQMKETALRYVERFDIHAMKRQYYQLYQSLLPAFKSRIGADQSAVVHPFSGRLTDEASV